MKNSSFVLVGVSILLAILFGCAATFYVPDAPPELLIEVRPTPPHPQAIWIDGHWGWSHGQYQWVPGYWERQPRGEWVPGSWEHRPRGWTWREGHWRRR